MLLLLFLLLFPILLLFLHFTHARSLDPSRDSVCSRGEFERTFDRASHRSSVSASFSGELDVAGSNPADSFF